MPGSGSANTGAFTYSGALTPFNSNYVLGGGGGTLDISSVLGNSGGTTTLTTALNGTTLGTVSLLNTETYTGITTIAAGTVLNLGAGGALPATNVTDNQRHR
jgi:hypothetical protein